MGITTNYRGNWLATLDDTERFIQEYRAILEDIGISGMPGQPDGFPEKVVAQFQEDLPRARTVSENDAAQLLTLMAGGGILEEKEEAKKMRSFLLKAYEHCTLQDFHNRGTQPKYGYGQVANSIITEDLMIRYQKALKAMNAARFLTAL